MSRPRHATLDDWIAREAIPFAVDSPASFDAAVDALIAALGGGLVVLDSTAYSRGGPPLS